MATLISIIIPVYNRKEELKRCLQSIKLQTCDNYEVIIVDDGSEETCGKAYDDLAKTYEFIKVIHQLNQGPAAARNTGLRHAKGDYIAFVDSDDEVEETYLQTLQNLITEYDADVSAVSYKLSSHKQNNKQIHQQNCKQNNKQTHQQNNKQNCKQNCKQTHELKTQVFYSDEAVRRLLYQDTLDSAVWGKLFRKEIIQDLTFSENFRVYEDLHFIYHVYKSSNKIVSTNQELYHYHKEDGGQMDSVSPTVTDAFDVMNAIREDIKTDSPGLLGAIDNRTISVSFNILKIISRSGQRNQKIENICWANIKTLRCKNFFDKNVRLKNKTGILISLLGKPFFMWFCRISKSSVNS